MIRPTESSSDHASPSSEAGELFHAHLEVAVHLLRDELRWNGSGGPEGRVSEVLHRERVGLLTQQRTKLEREARLRTMAERLVAKLEADPGLDTRDALAVAWFYRVEAAPALRRADSESEEARMESLLRRVGDAHARLLSGADPFLPGPIVPREGGFAMAVAVGATRLARRRNRKATWMDVEPLARRVLEVVTGRRP